MHAVRLIPIEPALAATVDEGAERFEAVYGAALGEWTELVRDVVRQTLALPSALLRPWGGYLAADTTAGMVIGTCAFKAAPDADGQVEIAYFTFRDFEGRGYGTNMARELIALAAASPLVNRVVAHTLPEPNASTRILEKVGMSFIGEVVDPEDELVWRWELETDSRGAAGTR